MPLRRQCATPARSLSSLSAFAADSSWRPSVSLGSTTSHLFAYIYSLSNVVIGVQNYSMPSQAGHPTHKGRGPGFTGPGRSHRKGIGFLELIQMFPNDEAAKRWFAGIRWPDGSVACPHCGSLNVQTGIAHKSMDYRCRERQCAKRFSVRSGTVMQSSNLGYQVWAIATYLVLTNLKGISSMRLHRELKITQKSAWHLAHRLRAALIDTSSGRFAGPVQADEVYLGGKAKNMHSKQRKLLEGGLSDKIGIAGIVDEPTNKIRTMVMEPEGQTLKEFVLSNTRRNAMVYTDDSNAYSGLPRHETVTHSAGEYVRGRVTTNAVESFWAMIERGIAGVYHKMSRPHAHRYATEFEARHNIRDDDTIDQMAAVAQGMEAKQLRYRDRTADGLRARRIAQGWKPPTPSRRRWLRPPAVDLKPPVTKSATTDPEPSY